MIIEAVWNNRDRQFNTRCLIQRLQRIGNDSALFTFSSPDGTRTFNLPVNKPRDSVTFIYCHVISPCMTLSNPFSSLAWSSLFDSLLPDFILGFTFFTALTYAVLGRRFDHQRSAVAASAAMGLALSVGLVWWEQAAGLSIRSLGPWAAGFAVIILAGIMYQSIRQTGGGFAGAGIALGASLLISWILGMRWAGAEQIIQTIITVSLIVGLVAFLLHRSSQHHAATFPPSERQIASPVEIKAVEEGHVLSDLLRRRLRQTKRRVDRLHEHPEDAEDVMLQLKRMLPAEGWLTERVARLREKAHLVQQGLAERIGEVQKDFRTLPDEAKKKAAEELSAEYKELGLDRRLERLDGAVAATERRIRELTRDAETHLAANDYARLHDVLKSAERLQKHNTHLFKLIDRSEEKLAATARRIAKGHTGVKGN